jgi:two-component system, NtrC family, sensor kinase
MNGIKNLTGSTSKTDSEKVEISKRELETVFDAIHEMICIIDSDFKILRVNKGYADFLGKKIKDLLGRNCYETFRNCNEKCADCPSVLTFRTGESVMRKHVIRKSSDDLRYFEIKTFPVLGDNNKTIHVIEFIKDVTEEKRMIEQLIRSEKLASVGIMTAGIAHEMNNPLSGISGNAVNLLEMPEKYGLNDRGISRISAILESAARATLIMKDLLHLSKKNNSTSVLVDINKLIIKTSNAVHLEGVGEIQKQFKLDESLPLVMCDPSKIDQVILNVVTNAIQSLIEKKQKSFIEKTKYSGRLTIATQKQGHSIIITITDNGMGIPQEIRSKIFDPFFSTKPTGQGTGLGLSICHRIVEEHRGKIFFETIDELTVFSVELPVEGKPSSGFIEGEGR